MFEENILFYWELFVNLLGKFVMLNDESAKNDIYSLI